MKTKEGYYIIIHLEFLRFKSLKKLLRMTEIRMFHSSFFLILLPLILLFPLTFSLSDFVSCICGDWNPIANLYHGWKLFVKLPIALLVTSFALLWLTVLSPHDIVFTAYLNDKGQEKE